MFSINEKPFKQFESDLRTMRAKSLPFATKATLNRTAFVAMKIARDTVRGKMILRNKYTLQSIRFEKTKTLRMRSQETFVGSTADYLEEQEFGRTITSTGKHGRPIAMPEASGERALPRKRLPRGASRFSKITLGKGSARGKNRRQRNAMAVREAAGKGKYVFLDLGRRSGIFRIRGKGERARLTKVWDMSRRIVRVPARPWLLPSATRAAGKIDQYYADALQFQLERLRSYR